MQKSSRSRRARAVVAMLAFTQGTRLEASPYEKYLLAEYAAGRLTLAQVEALLTAVPNAGGPALGR